MFYVALKLLPGKTTVMHMVARENISEPSSQGINPMVAYLLV